MLVLQLAARNALRRKRRTVLTAMTVLLGTALLTLGLAWLDGVFGQLTRAGANTAGHVRIVRPAYAEREDLLPIYENLTDVDALVERVRKVRGVVEAHPRIITGVTVSKGETIGDTFGPVMGAPSSWFESRLELGDKLVAGRLPNPPVDIWNADAPKKSTEIVIGATLAGEIGAEVGDELVMMGATQNGSLSPMAGVVVGIANAGNALLDQGLFLPLESVRYLTDMPGAATEVLVYTEDRNDAVELKEALQPGLGAEELAQAWSERSPFDGMLSIVRTIRGFLASLIVFVTAMGVWNTMMMSVLERTGEIGVMRAMGLSRLGAVVLCVVEGVAIAALGGVAGVGVGSIAATMLETWGVELGDKVVQNISSEIPFSTRLYADMSWSVAATAFALGLVMALVGTTMPALRAAAIQPVVAMRARR